MVCAILYTHIYRCRQLLEMYRGGWRCEMECTSLQAQSTNKPDRHTHRAPLRDAHSHSHVHATPSTSQPVTTFANLIARHLTQCHALRRATHNAHNYPTHRPRNTPPLAAIYCELPTINCSYTVAAVPCNSQSPTPEKTLTLTPATHSVEFDSNQRKTTNHFSQDHQKRTLKERCRPPLTRERKEKSGAFIE